MLLFRLMHMNASSGHHIMTSFMGLGPSPNPSLWIQVFLVSPQQASATPYLPTVVSAVITAPTANGGGKALAQNPLFAGIPCIHKQRIDPVAVSLLCTLKTSSCGNCFNLGLRVLRAMRSRGVGSLRETTSLVKHLPPGKPL